MVVKVTKTTVTILRDDYIVNDMEYRANSFEFEFSEEYTEELVKKALFKKDDTEIWLPIINNQCELPYEFTRQKDFELRVYAYENDGEQLILRYSPTPTHIFLRDGSYIGSTDEIITPSQFEIYEQKLYEGLLEVGRVNIDAVKEDHVSTISITNRYGEVKEVELYDGVNGVDGKDGVDGRDGIDGSGLYATYENDTLYLHTIENAEERDY